MYSAAMSGKVYIFWDKRLQREHNNLNITLGIRKNSTKEVFAVRLIIEIIWVAIGFVVLSYLLIRIVPRNRLREAFIAFLFNQMITWSIGTLLFQSGRVVSPVRPFPNATHAYFWDGFVFYPAIAVLYYFSTTSTSRHRSVLITTAMFSLVLILWEFVEINWTDARRYVDWNYAYMFFLAAAAFFLTRWFTLFFFRSIESRGNPV